MPSTLGRNLNLCFTKIKSPLNITQSPYTSQAPSDADEDDDDDHNRPLPKSSSSTTETMIKNFNSLYDHHQNNNNHKTTSDKSTLTRSFSSFSSESDSHYDSACEPDFATIYASQRFFVTSPGRSNSIVESTPSISNSPSDQSLCDQSNESSSLQSWRRTNNKSSPSVKDSVAVSTYSPDPYMDFRRSMQEMVEARDMHVNDVEANWDYLHELLLCYLALNPKSTHKFIIGAFADLLVSLKPPPAAVDGGQRRL